MPVESGSPVALVSVPADGVPSGPLTGEYHCVVEDALKYAMPLTGRVTAAFVPAASMAPPAAGYTLIGLAPLLATTIRNPATAVGSVTPDGLLAAVVTTLKSLVSAP